VPLTPATFRAIEPIDPMAVRAMAHESRSRRSAACSISSSPMTTKASRVAGQQEEGRRALGDEFVAHRGGAERVHVEFDEGAAARSEVVPQNPGPGRPVDTRLGCYGDSAVARAEQEVRVDPPAVGLRRGEACDPFRGLFGERVENRRRAEERQAEGIGPGGGGAGDDAVVLPRQRGHAQAGQFVHGRRGPLRIGRGVPDHQFEWSSVDPAGVIDVANGQFESGEQVPSRLGPAGPGQRNEGADPDGRRWWRTHVVASPG
jgi:hypothetical protein